MADTESVLSFIPPTLPPSSVCSLNFPLFADCLISPSMPDCFPAFSKQHNRRMDSYGVRARHCIPFSHFWTRFYWPSWRSFRWGELQQCPDSGSGAEKSFFSPKEPLEKGGSARQPAGATWNRMEETGLSWGLLSLLCVTSRRTKDCSYSPTANWRETLSCQRQSGQTIAFPFYK